MNLTNTQRKLIKNVPLVFIKKIQIGRYNATFVFECNCCQTVIHLSQHILTTKGCSICPFCGDEGLKVDLEQLTKLLYSSDTDDHIKLFNTIFKHEYKRTAILQKTPK